MSEVNVVVTSNKLLPRDISSEEYREYDLGDRVYHITSPKQLYVGHTTHRVVDDFGQVHCVPFPEANGKIVVLRWRPKIGADPVQF